MESLVNEERGKPISELPGCRPPARSIDFIDRAVHARDLATNFRKKCVSRLIYTDRLLRSRIQDARARTHDYHFR